MKLTDRIQHAWNAFQSKDPPKDFVGAYMGRYPSQYMTVRFSKTDLVRAVISRIALDASMVDIKHLKIDSNTGNQTPVPSNLIDCLTFEANKDQTGRSFMYDAYWSLLDEGVIALVPVDTTVQPVTQGGFDVNSIRVAKITAWYTDFIRVEIYNDKIGTKQQVTLPKNMVAIVESPLYTVLKESNQTLRLLQAKIKAMGAQDARIQSGKIDAFIQLPYATKSDLRAKRAKDRSTEIENQVTKSDYGIAFLDANEKVIPMNKPLQNNILDDITRLTQDFYNQVGITQNILNGTASEQETLTYYSRAVDPIVTAVLEEMNRKFITKTARTQGQALYSYRDPFKLVPTEQLAQIGDTLLRNTVLTPNEFRAKIGFPPHPNPVADQLRNPNIADTNQVTSPLSQPIANQNMEDTQNAQM